jgi:hypothetical protein
MEGIGEQVGNGVNATVKFFFRSSQEFLAFSFAANRT